MSDFDDDLENYFYNSDDPELDLLTEEQRTEIKHQSMENTYTLISNNYDFEVLNANMTVFTMISNPSMQQRSYLQ